MSSCFNGDWHGRQLGVVAGLLAMLACGSASAQRPADNLPFENSASGRVYNGTTPLRLWHQTRGYGMEASQTAFGGRLAVDLADAIGFMDGQFRVSNESQFGLDIGGGFRWMGPSLLTGDTRVFGVTGWYDGQETNLNNYFNQLGVSFESLGEQIDFRMNANIPLEDEKSGDIVIDTGEVTYFQNFLSIGTLIPTDVALRVVDFEVAPRIFDLNAWVYAGGYQMDGEGVSDLGAKGGVRGYVTNDLAVDVGVQDDDTFGTNTVFQIIWTPGRTGAGPTSWVHTLADRMREQVYRNTYVATTQVERAGADNLTNVDGQDIRVVHVDFSSTAPGDGTFENPYTSLDSVNGTGSQQGDIILVHAQPQGDPNVYTGQSVNLKDEQRLLGEGNNVNHQVVTQQMGTIDLPATFDGAIAGTRPTIQNAPGVAVTLAGSADESENFAGMEVSNFVITGGTSAIDSDTNGVATVDLNNLEITSTSSHGIDLAAMTQTLENGTTRSRFNVTIDEVEFNSVGGDDILLTSTTSQTTISHATAISNIDSTNGNGVGIHLVQNQRAATIDNFNWNGGTTGDGALFIDRAAAQGSVTLSNSENGVNNEITGGQANTAYAIRIEDSAATHTVTGTNIAAMGGTSVVVNDGLANLNFTGKITQTTNAQTVLNVTGGHTGTLTFVELEADGGVIEADRGDGLQFDQADGNYIFTDQVTLDGVSEAINVNDSDGTLTFQNAEISDTTGTAITFTGGEASMTLTGSIEQSTAQTVLSVTGDHDGTLTFNETTANAGVINATAGNGLQFNNANGAYIFNDKVTLDGADPVINVVASDDGATFTFAEVDIDYDGAGSAVTVSNSELQAFTISGDIDVAGAAGGRPVLINNNTGGSITFNTTIDSSQNGILVTGNTDTTIRFAGQTTLTTGANNAVTLTNNTNGGVRFDNIDITTTGAGTGFVASDTDNLTVQGTGNTITTATGVALSLTDVEVGTAGVTFASVTATGGTNAVYLEDVTGGTVTINGGTITGTTADAVAVVGGANLSLNNMTISAGGAGDGVNIDLTTNVASTISVANSTITSANGLGIDYNRGSLVANTTRLTLTSNTVTTSNDQGIGIDINGSGTANVTVNGATQVTSVDDQALAITTSGGSGKTLNLLVDGGTFNNNSSTASATTISTGGSGTINATVTNNTFNNSDATTGRGFTASTNSAASTLRLNLDANSATGGATDDPFLLDQNSGTFRVEDLATVQARNTGAIEQQGTITNYNGPIPTP